MSHQQAIDLPPLPASQVFVDSDGDAHGAFIPSGDLYTADQVRAAMRTAILADRSRSAAPVAVPDGFVLVPRDPTEEMWVHLARDIVWFLYSTSAPHRGVKFYKWLDNMGREAPAWLRAEIPDVDHSPSKGTWAVCIYKAMLAAAAAPPGLAPLVAGVGEVL